MKLNIAIILQDIIWEVNSLHFEMINFINHEYGVIYLEKVVVG